MLDETLKEQLHDVFSKLTGTVTLRVARSSHADQEELLSMLKDIVSTSDKIRLELAAAPESPESKAPRFEVIGSSGQASIAFRGIPGGHEFSSLVLAILNSDGKGKLPDAGIQARIHQLRGPIRLKTYVSLSCENCPEVVQALNVMALVHPDFQHETIDGAIAQDEVEALGIQGVPSVISDGSLIHSGKAQLIDLLSKLEEVFGKSGEGVREENLGVFDVVVIGGGPAGASAAIYSARKGLKTAIVAERMGGQLQETKGIENMISVPYTEGVKLSAELARHIQQYPIQVLEHRRVSQITGENPKRVTLESGEYLDTPVVIIATGARWRQLGIPGEKEHIGQGVAFCAHCDGPFYKGKRVVVVGGGNSGVEAALDLANITSDVTLLEFSDKLKADDVLVSKLQALPNAKIITQAKSTRVIGDGKKVTGLEYQDLASKELRVLETDGVFVQIGLLPNSHFCKDTVECTPYGEIVVDPKGRTNVPGIYAAGDVATTPFKQIVVAMGDGAKVALTAFEDRLRNKSA
ncbi:MAG: alkyl hydroperoxide reductase subunit F [Oligoflexia bacterium]|nr:alkyl hydroperoxide reductase subunit F [Oligoflexia bacterium]